MFNIVVANNRRQLYVLAVLLHSQCMYAHHVYTKATATVRAPYIAMFVDWKYLVSMSV
jgi:hypothetical protein